MTRASLAALILAAGGGAVAVNGQTLGESTVTATISQTFEFDDNYSAPGRSEPGGVFGHALRPRLPAGDLHPAAVPLRQPGSAAALGGRRGFRRHLRRSRDRGRPLRPGLGRWRLRRLCALQLPTPRRGADPPERFRVHSDQPRRPHQFRRQREPVQRRLRSRAAHQFAELLQSSASTRARWTTRTSTRIRPTARCRATRSPARRSGRCA